MTDLTLVPIEDIYNELDKRLPSHIILSIRPGAGSEFVQVKMQGSKTMCLGMMDVVANKMRNSVEWGNGNIKD
jgi:hypothetical protein